MYNKNQPTKKILPILIFLMISLTACSASEQPQDTEPSQAADKTEIDSSKQAYCDSWGDYAITMLENYEAQITAGTDNPFDRVKSWITYDNSEEGSPGRAYFDAVLVAVEAQQPPQMVREVGQATCAQFTKDQMDSANFYDAIK
ncbi:MAG: hypothetical protein ACJAYF_001663 [Arenicella sp.]|jgi:hypothetical protein